MSRRETLTIHPDLGQAIPEQAYLDFASGRVAAFVCTLDQVRRFAALEAVGKGFSYRVRTLPSGFCDQILMAGIPVAEREAERLKMAETLLQALTRAEAQKHLTTVRLTSRKHSGASAQQCHANVAGRLFTVPGGLANSQRLWLGGGARDGLGNGASRGVSGFRRPATGHRVGAMKMGTKACIDPIRAV